MLREPLKLKAHLARSSANTKLKGDSLMTGTTDRIPFSILTAFTFGGTLSALYASYSPASASGTPIDLFQGGAGTATNNGDGFVGGTQYFGVGHNQIREAQFDGTSMTTTDGAIWRVNYAQTRLTGATNSTTLTGSRPMWFRPTFYCPDAGVSALSNIEWVARAAQGSSSGTLIESGINFREHASDFNGGITAPTGGEMFALARGDGSDFYSAYELSSATRFALCHPSGGTQSPNDSTWLISLGCLIYQDNGSGTGWAGGHAIAVESCSSAAISDYADNLTADASNPKRSTVAETTTFNKAAFPPGATDSPLHTIVQLNVETTATAADFVAMYDNEEAAAIAAGFDFDGVTIVVGLRDTTVTIAQESAWLDAISDACSQRSGLAVVTLDRITDYANFNTMDTAAVAYLTAEGYDSFSYGTSSAVNMTTKTSIVDPTHPSDQDSANLHVKLIEDRINASRAVLTSPFRNYAVQTIGSCEFAYRTIDGAVWYDDSEIGRHATLFNTPSPIAEVERPTQDTGAESMAGVTANGEYALYTEERLFTDYPFSLVMKTNVTDAAAARTLFTISDVDVSASYIYGFTAATSGNITLVGRNTTQYTDASSVSLLNNKQVIVLVAASATDLRLYADGVEIAQITSSVPNFTPSGVALGSFYRSSTSAGTITGTIESVYGFSKELSLSEIEQVTTRLTTDSTYTTLRRGKYGIGLGLGLGL